jgi:hypothetical protein
MIPEVRACSIPSRPHSVANQTNSQDAGALHTNLTVKRSRRARRGMRVSTAAPTTSGRSATDRHVALELSYAQRVQPAPEEASGCLVDASLHTIGRWSPVRMDFREIPSAWARRLRSYVGQLARRAPDGDG